MESYSGVGVPLPLLLMVNWETVGNKRVNYSVHCCDFDSGSPLVYILCFQFQPMLIIAVTLVKVLQLFVTNLTFFLYTVSILSMFYVDVRAPDRDIYATWGLTSVMQHVSLILAGQEERSSGSISYFTNAINVRFSDIFLEMWTLGTWPWQYM